MTMIGNPAVHGQGDFEAVGFGSEGAQIADRLFEAAFCNGPAPAAVILGPMSFQKEQAPTLYAQRLAKLGFAALIFDPRYRGESGGEPRCLEGASHALRVAADEPLGRRPRRSPGTTGTTRAT